MTESLVTIAVLYHQDADGFGAAYACWKHLPENEVVYIPVQYGQPVPELPPTIKKIYIVDFSYKREICDALTDGYDLIVIDHHKTAEEELRGAPYAIFDMNFSGATLTWHYFQSLAIQSGVLAISEVEPLPTLLQYVQDYDLWKFELPLSREVNLYIATLPTTFTAWDTFDVRDAQVCGIAIMAFQARQIERRLKEVQIGQLGGIDVPMVNCTDNISELGNEMCKRYPEYPFSVSYCDRKDNTRTYSLRSIGDFDVSEIARSYGGGGHKNAAGFSVQMFLGNV